MGMYKLKVDESGKTYLPKELREELNIVGQTHILVHPRRIEGREGLVVLPDISPQPDVDEFTGIMSFAPEEWQNLVRRRLRQVASEE